MRKMNIAAFGAAVLLSGVPTVGNAVEVCIQHQSAVLDSVYTC